MIDLKRLIKNKLQEKNKSQKWLALQLGLSETGLHRAIRMRSFKMDMLFQLSKLLDIHISTFFYEEGSEFFEIISPEKFYSMFKEFLDKNNYSITIN